MLCISAKRQFYFFFFLIYTEGNWLFILTAERSQVQSGWGGGWPGFLLDSPSAPCPQLPLPQKDVTLLSKVFPPTTPARLPQSKCLKMKLSHLTAIE